MNMKFSATLIIALTFTMVNAQTQLNLISNMFGQQEMEDGAMLFTHGYIVNTTDPLVVPGPTLYMNEGDSVILDMWNLSFVPHTVHLHGMDVDQANDGVPQFSYAIENTEHGYYHLRAPHAGTYIYHCHYVSSIHLQAGMYGVVVVKPADGSDSTWTGGFAYDNDYIFLAAEMDAEWHAFDIMNQDHDPNNGVHTTLPVYDPEYFLVNGFSGTQLTQNNVGVFGELGEVNHLRLNNMGYYTTRWILPEELNALIVASDGRPLPSYESSDTVWVYPGERYDIIADPAIAFNGSISVEYVNMNTGLVEDVQFLEVAITMPTGISELEVNALGLGVNPNPIANSAAISFELDQAENLSIEIFDLGGKRTEVVAERAFAQGKHLLVWQPQVLAKGNYVLRLSAEGVVLAEKQISIFD